MATVTSRHISVSSSPVEKPLHVPQAAIDSSPGLPSPSALLRIAQTGLKSGSRKAQLPEGMSIGFTSATTLYRELQVEAEQQLDDGTGTDSERDGERGDLSGITSKSTASWTAEDSAVPKPRVRKEHLEAVRKRKTGRTETEKVLLAPMLHSQPRVQDDESTITEAKNCRPSLSLSGHALAGLVEPPTIKGKDPNLVKPAPKRKRAPQTATAEQESKKARKPPKTSATTPLGDGITLADQEVVLQDGQTGTGVETALQNASLGEKITTAKKPRVRKPKPKAQAEAEADNAPSALEEAPRKRASKAKLAFVGEEESTTVSHAKAVPVSTTVTEVRHVSGDQAETADDVSPHFSAALVEAPRRRTSWTPPRETGLPPSHQPLCPSEALQDSAAAATPASALFTQLLGNFGYQDHEASASAVVQRAVSGEALSKRLKVDLVNAPSVEKAVPKKRRTPAEKPKKEAVKKVKSPKKKPLTITDLAMAAYRPQQALEVMEAGRSVLDFFVPQQRLDSPELITELEAAPLPPIPKTKKAKGKAKEVTDTRSEAKKAPTTKKVRIADQTPPPPLPPPEAAQQQMRNQDFLFGTSSQLAGDESPAFLRQVQLALKESEEAMDGSQSFSPATSRFRVPTAPHGTCLSLDQTERSLWTFAARDSQRGLLAPEEPLFPNSPKKNTLEAERLLEGDRPIVLPEEKVDEQVELMQDSKHDSMLEDHFTASKDEDESGFISIERFDQSEISVRRKSPSENEQAAAPMVVNTRHHNVGRAESAANVKTVRNILQPLDANASPSRFSASVQPMPAMRGKTTKAAPAVTSSEVQAGQPPEKRTRGRPRKTPLTGPATSPLKKCQKSERTLKPSTQPTKTPPRKKRKSSSTKEEWLNIDDISDHETPPSPSPPRRRKSSSPLTQTLELATSAGTVAPSQPVLSLKDQKAADWANIAATLFPRISNAIRSAPRSADVKSPSWHEKILLYDPIVLEDLTGWLNAQGLRTESAKGKDAIGNAKTKAKGKKGKQAADAATETEPAGPAGPGGLEVVKDELKPWMVQQWCEKNSVCCLWKEGLRGGVRNRY